MAELLDIRMSITAQNQHMQIDVQRNSPSMSMIIDKSMTPPEPYEGEYTVMPILYDETVLQTAWKTLNRNVTVLPIKIHEVSNPKGGKTITIGAV